MAPYVNVNRSLIAADRGWVFNRLYRQCHDARLCREVQQMYQGRSRVSKIGGVHSPFYFPVSTNVQLQRSKASRGEDCPSPEPTRRSGERRKLRQWSLQGRSPNRKRFLGVSCAILCNFTHLLVHLTVAWKREVPYILLLAIVGLMFPFNSFGVSNIPLGCRTPQLEFLGCPDTHHTHSGCATEIYI